MGVEDKRKRTKSVSLKDITRHGCFTGFAVFLGLFLGYCMFIFGGLWLGITDFVDPVTRIEYVLRTEFPTEVQVLEAEYHRTGWDDDYDSFSISLTMPHSIAENFILEQCEKPLQELPTMWSNSMYEHVISGEYSCGTGFFVSYRIDIISPELYRFDIVGQPECYSKNPFSAALPCRN
jgi:hypothetical protein